jgi:hypothetical protein
MVSLINAIVTYPEADSKDGSDTNKRGGHTTVQASDTISLHSLGKAVKGAFIDTFCGLKANLDQIERLTLEQKNGQRLIRHYSGPGQAPHLPD